MRKINVIHQENATVISTVEIAKNTFETLLESPLIADDIKPGQFINILPSPDWEKMMRRPMSVASQSDGKLSIIYKVVGEGTELMRNWSKGESVDLIGPLGNKWSGYENIFSILIGGGVGIAPILNQYNKLKMGNFQQAMIMGARTADEHFIDHQPDKNIYMTTDDGTMGIHGNVLKPLKSLMQKQDKMNTKVFACGPAAMMEAIREYCLQKRIPCDLALETVMACGFGICQGCTVERKVNNLESNSYRDRFALACLDGPVFSAEEIVRCG